MIVCDSFGDLHQCGCSVVDLCKQQSYRHNIDTIEGERVTRGLEQRFWAGINGGFHGYYSHIALTNGNMAVFMVQ